MLDFRALTPDDAPTVKAYLSHCAHRLSDITMGTLFMWRDYLHTQIAAQGGSLFIKIAPPDITGYLHYIPLSRDFPAAVRAAAEDMRKAGEEPRFSTVSREQLAALRGVLNIKRAVTSRNWHDYLYDAPSLAAMAGRKYAGQRNHIHKFEKACPLARFVPYSTEYDGALRRFTERFYAKNPTQDATAEEERRKLMDMLHDLERFSLFASLLVDGEEIAALAVGEILGDTLFVHTEKADTSYPGAYQTVVRRFAQAHAGEGVLYINREEDLGIEGLRVSKQSYHPLRLLEKYTVTVALP
ncbi:MAG: phosphatidylglycerol lysyltransferase domain-containing protein [Oscillospiraceae bacterium]|jgi:hypothetical protein|nr:phosphatidylglycerol lysyltransferase domain-containing protein [Oscillospiraceae bacterium]